MNYTREDIERANGMDILEVARDLNIELKRTGTVYRALCLWHNDSRPSMQVGGTQNTCHCYACGETHGVIDLVMKAKDIGFKEAMEWVIDSPPALPGGRELHFPGKEDRKRIAQPNYEGRRARRSQLRIMNYELNRYVDASNSLSRCLAMIYPASVVQRVTNDYMLGTCTAVHRSDHTLFPSIDIKGRVHNVKLQMYCSDPKSVLFGHKVGEPLWVGKKMIEMGLLSASETDTNCLFGEHLLARHPNSVVGLVESPKNAVVCACQWPDMVWVATGNKGMLKRPLLEVLRGRQVLVMPDNDARQEWCDKLMTMQDIATFRVWEGDDDDNDDDDDALRYDDDTLRYDDDDPSTGSGQAHDKGEKDKGEKDKSDIADRLLRI